MFGIIKLFIFIIFLILSFTVPLGSKTFAGHIMAIWQSEETREMRAGISETVEELKDKHGKKLQKNICNDPDSMSTKGKK